MLHVVSVVRRECEADICSLLPYAMAMAGLRLVALRRPMCRVVDGPRSIAHRQYPVLRHVEAPSSVCDTGRRLQWHSDTICDQHYPDGLHLQGFLIDRQQRCDGGCFQLLGPSPLYHDPLYFHWAGVALSAMPVRYIAAMFLVLLWLAHGELEALRDAWWVTARNVLLLLMSGVYYGCMLLFTKLLPSQTSLFGA